MEIPIPALRIMGWAKTPHLSLRATLVSTEGTWCWDPARVPGRDAKEPGRVCSSGRTSHTEPSRCPIKTVLEKMKSEFAVVLPARVRGFAVSDPLAQSSLRVSNGRTETRRKQRSGDRRRHWAQCSPESAQTFPSLSGGRKKPQGQGPTKKI